MPYKVPFVDVPTAFNNLREPIMEAITNVLSRGNIILRQELRDFEAQFAEFAGVKYAVGVNSGTDAVQFALRAAEIGPGDEVITVSHTCIATVAAIVNAGATPVLVDVKADFTMDVEKAEAAITPKTKAIVPVHLNGRACDLDAVLAVAEKHDLLVIEDCAQAVGARYDGRSVGSFSPVAGFSLYPFKMLGGYGDGGIVVTDDPEMAKTVSMLRDYGEDRETGEIHYFGFNSRLDNLQAAILSVKLPHLQAWIERRQEIARRYNDGLRGLPGLAIPEFPGEKNGDCWLNYTLCTPQRDALVAHLRECSVEPLVPISLVKPVHRHAALKLEHFDLPETDRIAREFLYMPIHPELSDEQVDYAIACVRSFFA